MKRVDITSIFSGPKGLRRKGAANQPYALFAIKYATARFFVLCRAAFAARKAGQLNIRELGAGRGAIQFWSRVHLLHVQIIAHRADGFALNVFVLMKIFARRLNRRMPQDSLHNVERHFVFHQPRRQCVPQRVGIDLANLTALGNRR